jgi:transcriptional regulator with XRE-family HTH domain
MNAASFGERLRTWRRARHLSQEELAERSEVSSRHLSFLETGRAQPSREMVLRLCRWLEVPLRDRNQLLTFAGFAPTYREGVLDEEELAPIRDALQFLLAQHEPFPAAIMDRHWDLVMANRAALRLVTAITPSSPASGMNMMRALFDPALGARDAIVNFDEIAPHMVERLREEASAADATPKTRALYDQLARHLPRPEVEPVPRSPLLPLKLRVPEGILSLYTAITTLGTPLDVTLSELRMETYFPGDPETAAILKSWA